MGSATMAVLIASNVLVALLRGWITAEVRIPAFVLIIATLVTVVDLAMNAWLHELHKVLGLFIPLIVVNCLILGRAESFASNNGVVASAIDGLAMGAGFTHSLTALGAVRELGGSGTRFAGAATLLGPAMAPLQMRICHLSIAIGIPGRSGYGCASTPLRWLPPVQNSPQFLQKLSPRR